MLAEKTYDVEVEGIKKLTITLKNLKISQQDILNNLKEQYGDHFSDKELKEIMEEV